ncbi:MAG TPA: cytochrome C oxidase subunit IV family protein [Steroidobacteraceae bacterium]|nr:cytochrome C oxidase subunit IV family protein [Steroidobacteraceae bacterium]
MSALRLPATRVWLVLIAAAVSSWTVSEHSTAVKVAASAVVLIAALKVRLIVMHFMELRWRPRPWRMLFELWTFGVTAIILGGYWMTEL